MPIKIPESLPARAILEREGVMVMDEGTALRQDIRPMQIALLNLMPDKISTETQFARLIGATPLQIDLTLVRMSQHRSINTPSEHLEAFYRPWTDVRAHRFDGLIITGAPIELLPFEEVTYWAELREVFDWTEANVFSTFAVCWGAQAMLHYFHGVAKHALAHKAFGCFRHNNHMPGSPYLRGFSDDFIVPVSRHTEIRENELPKDAVRVLASAPATGPCLIEDMQRRALYMFNHLEYDTQTLGREYQRDVDAGKEIQLPENYFPDDDPSQKPRNRWRGHAHLLFANWLNEIYQNVPFDFVDQAARPSAQERAAAMDKDTGKVGVR
ncbi:MAG: homoserine O-succinyltransferase [Neomegalonema sp.]|nr:homoserine O-succinyltransferase [Neomegalonema sp.]